MPKVHMVHHGVPMDEYPLRSQKKTYVAFLGRIAPCKVRTWRSKAAMLGRRTPEARR